MTVLSGAQLTTMILELESVAGPKEPSVSPLSCVMCPYLMFPYLVCFLSLFNVIIS